MRWNHPIELKKCGRYGFGMNGRFWHILRMSLKAENSQRTDGSGEFRLEGPLCGAFSALRGRGLTRTF